MTCVLCETINEDFRLIMKSEHSFCIVNRDASLPGHVMVMPRRCVKKMSDLNGEEAVDFLDMIDQVREALNKAYGLDCLIGQNQGKNSSQPHLHLHVLPCDAPIRGLIATHFNVPLMDEKDKEFFIATKEKIVPHL